MGFRALSPSTVFLIFIKGNILNLQEFSPSPHKKISLGKNQRNFKILPANLMDADHPVK